MLQSEFGSIKTEKNSTFYQFCRRSDEWEAEIKQYFMQKSLGYGA